MQGTVMSGRKVVIVGTGETGAAMFEYFSHDSEHEIVAFSTERPYITDGLICGCRVVPLDELAATYPPTDYRAFVAVSMINLNRVRRRLYAAVKAMGFQCVSFISSRASVAPSASIGENAIVLENAVLQYNTRIGDNVYVCSGAYVGHSAVLEDDCYLGPDAAVCGFAKIGRSSFLGAKSCIADGLSVAEDCLVGAGAIVLRDTVKRQVYMGNPARPIGRDSLEISSEH